MSINGSSSSCHPRRDAELIPICNRLLTDLHVIRKMKPSRPSQGTVNGGAALNDLPVDWTLYTTNQPTNMYIVIAMLLITGT